MPLEDIGDFLMIFTSIKSTFVLWKNVEKENFLNSFEMFYFFHARETDSVQY